MFHGQKKTGFTLIELMMVIAIIGLLSSVVLAAVQDSRAAARDAQRITSAKQLQNAVELFRNTNGSYPCSKNAGTVCTTPHSIAFNDGTPTTAGSTSTRQRAFRTDLALFIGTTTDPILSGTVAGITYPDFGSILYFPEVGYNSYTIVIYGEESANPICRLTANNTDC